MIKVFFKAYSSLLFNDKLSVGVVLFCLSFLNYSVALSGVVAVVSSMAFIYFLKFENKTLLEGFYLYNSLLTGMSIGYFFTPTLLSLTLITVLSIFTFLISFMLSHIMNRYGMALLSLPFAMVSIVSYLLLSKYINLFPQHFNQIHVIDISLPLLFDSLFKAFGTIFFLPNSIAGIVILLLLLFYSRIMFVVGIIGFYFGVFLHALLLNSWNQALLDPYNFNYILTALALNAVFLLPTFKNFLLTLLAITITVILGDALSLYFNYYALTLPFNIVVNLFLFILYFFKHQTFNYTPFFSPENSLSTYLSTLFRFQPYKIQIALPFSGKWHVYQAFDGEWTHKGLWSHAYDFIIKKREKSYQNQGNFVEDYFCYGEAVLSPVYGYVVDWRDDLKDNPIGVVDKINNWGNFIIIQSTTGYFVEISHLMNRSLNVKVGDYVTMNTPLGKCGNSGYSSEPHLHIQVQKFATLGSPTIDFCFSHFVNNQQLIFQALPELEKPITNLIIHQNSSQTLSFLPNEEYHYAVYQEKRYIDSFRLTVKMNYQYEYYFEDKSKNRLFFYKTDTLFYFYNYVGEESYLKKLFILSPKIPLTNEPLTFQEYLPRDLFESRIKKMLTQLWITINPQFYMKKHTYTLENNLLQSNFGEVVLDNKHKGFKYLHYQTIELKRVYK